MAREIRARFWKGKIELLEHVDLEEGEELVVTVPDRAPEGPSLSEAIRAVSGGWIGLVDTEALKRHITEDRRSSRPAPRSL